MLNVAIRFPLGFFEVSKQVRFLNPNNSNGIFI